MKLKFIKLQFVIDTFG